MALKARRHKPMPVKLFCGLIGRRERIEEVVSIMGRRFGEIDVESPIIPFDVTDYYTEEMGSDLMRMWVSFKGLRERGFLALAKHVTLEIETDLANDGKRSINIDPGYVDNAQVVLATTKNYAHRIYIGMGYYAEVTLIYRRNGFVTLEWTYPDYRSPVALEFFTQVRSIYHDEVSALET